MLINVLKTVRDLSDKDYQRRVWIEGKGPECDDLGDTADFFIDVGGSVLKKHKDFGITESQYRLLFALWTDFKHFFLSPERPCFPNEFIDTPEWTQITEMAKKTLKAFGWEQSADYRL